MKRVLMGLVITVVLAGVIILDKVVGRIVPLVFFALAAALAILEMRKTLGSRIPDCFNIFYYIYAPMSCVPLIVAVALGWDFFVTGVLSFLFWFVAASLVAMKSNVRNGGFMYAIFPMVYPALPFSAFIYICSLVSESGDIYLTAAALAVTVSSMTDVFAYMFGKHFGKHKLCPALSPNKTKEGAAGGIIGGIFGAAAIYVLFQVADIFSLGVDAEQTTLIVCYIISGVVGGIADQFGDLVASLVKRDCGVKDYGKILGSHGGIMDRFDGMIMCACVVAVVFGFLR